MTEKPQDRVTTALTIVSAIIAFRVVNTVVGTAWFFLRKIPCTLAMRVHSIEFIVVPSIAVAVAILVSRWHETKLNGARMKTRVGILLILAVVAFLPIQFGVKAELPTICREQLCPGRTRETQRGFQPSPGP